MTRKGKLTKEQIQIIFKRLKPIKDPETGKIIKWKGNKTALARELGVTPKTIYNYLERYEKSPIREPRVKPYKPKIIEEWEESETVKDFIKAKEGVKKHKDYLAIGMKAWRILKKKDPITWMEEDYSLLWNHPDLIDEMTGRISFPNAVALRQWMKHCKRYDLLKEDKFSTKGLKRPKGRYKTHWLKTEDEIVNVINNIEYPDTLMLFNIGIQCGARHSSMKKMKPKHISYATNEILMFEPKVKQYIERDFPTETLENLKKYIYDFRFKANQLIFPRDINLINQDLKQAGKKANISFELTTHKAIKHTFVSLASNRGVSLEIVSDQTGTDPNTLMDFYAGIAKRKKRHELLGEPYKEPSFHILIKRIQPIVKKRYIEIKDRMIAKDGIKARAIITKKGKTKKPKRINWETIKKMVRSEKTPENLKKTWKKALKLHNKGLSDSAVKKEMGWKT